MAWNYCFSTIGLIFLMFRFYVLEIRCKDIFKPRNRYLSRFLAYYYFIALALNFQIKFLNLTLFVSYFLELYIVADHDLKFLLRYYRHEELNNGENRNGWVLFERLTLHIPLVLTCTVWIFSDLDVFYLTDGSPPQIWEMMAALFLGITTFLLFDVRNPFGKKFEAPLGKHIFSFIIGSWILVILILYVFCPLFQ